MDVNDLRSAVTVLSFLCFIGIVAWALASKRKNAFCDAANLPLEDEAQS
jgi:cytochrome c oxidase cbb3-type subunit IV